MIPTSIITYILNHHAEFQLSFDEGSWIAAIYTTESDSDTMAEGDTPEDAIAALDLKLREMQA